MDGTTTTATETKFCKECGAKIAKKAVICPHCGCQVEETAAAQPQIVINNSNQNQNNVNAGIPYGLKRCDKWVSILLCLFLGMVGAHKFYEGKAGMGILYILTGGLFAIGCFVDFIALLLKPNPYYV